MQEGVCTDHLQTVFLCPIKRRSFCGLIFSFFFFFLFGTLAVFLLGGGGGREGGLFNAGFSPERYWRERRSQVGERVTTPIAADDHQNDFCIQMGSGVNHLNASLTVSAQSKE